MGQSVVLGPCSTGASAREKQVAGRAKGGHDVLRGVLEIAGAPSAAVGAATRLAVAEALASVVGRAAVGSGGGSGKRRRGHEPGNVEVTRSPQRPGASRNSLRFAYAVRFADPLSAEAAFAALELERGLGGRKRLLPRFLASLRAHGEAPLSEDDEEEPEKLQVSEWTVESLSVPGKGVATHDALDSEIAAFALAASDTLACLQGACHGDPEDAGIYGS